jgi:hypothetical protein
MQQLQSQQQERPRRQHQPRQPEWMGKQWQQARLRHLGQGAAPAAPLLAS